MSTPRRIQLRRAKGWRKPSGTVVVTRPTKWGNPFKPEDYGGARYAVLIYQRYAWGEVLTTPEAITDAYAYADRVSGYAGVRLFTPDDAVRELRGKNLACWCRLCEKHRDGKPLGVECADCAPCHADILLEVANG